MLSLRADHPHVSPASIRESEPDQVGQIVVVVPTEILTLPQISLYARILPIRVRFIAILGRVVW